MQAFYKPLAAAVTLALCVGAQAADNERYIVKFKEGKGPSTMAQMKAMGAKMELDLSAHNAAAFPSRLRLSRAWPTIPTWNMSKRM